VLSGDDPNAGFVSNFPLPLHALGPSRSRFAYAPKMGQWLDNHIHEYDAVIGNGIWQYPNLALHQAAKKAKKPYWIFTHGMLDPWFNDAYPLKKLKKMLYWPFQYRFLKDAKGVLFTCEEEMILARKSFRPYHVRERVVSYGTAGPPDRAKAHRETFENAFPHLAKSRFLLYLSRLHPKKGGDLLIKAFAEVAASDPDLKLVFAGPDVSGYQSILQGLAQRLNILDRVFWIGMVEGDTKWGAFQSAEAFVLPSHQENFSIAVVEALACSCPVLISNSVNIWREIVSADAGLVEHDDLPGTTLLLKRWISLPAEKRLEMGKNAIQCFNGHFSAEKSATSLIEALSE